MTSPTVEPRHAFAAERQALLIGQAPVALLIAAGLVAVYSILNAWWGTPLSSQRTMLVLIEVCVPLIGVALLRNFPAHLQVEPTLLLLDTLFTTVLVSELLLPTANTPGVAIVLGLKTATTALVFPWAPRWQAAAATYALFAFTVGARGAETTISSEAMIALVIGAVVSVVGCVILDRHRVALHLKQIESAESEQKYRSLTEGTVASVFVYQDDRFRFVNDACAKMLGYRREELVGRSNKDLHRPEDLALVHRMVTDLESGVRTSFESVMRAYRRDGSELSGRASFSRILYEGRPAVLGVVIDETEERAQQHKAEELAQEVAASEARHRDLFENANDLIVEIDRHGRFVDANRAALAIVGYQRADLARGLSMADLFPPENLPPLEAFRADLLAGRPVHQPQTISLNAVDGTVHAIEMYTRLIQRPGKEPVFQSIGRDVTERQAHLSEAQRMVVFQRALTAVAPTLHAPHGLDETFALIATVCRELFDVTTVRLWTIEDEMFVGRGASGNLAEQVPTWRFSIKESALPAMAVRERRPMFVNRLAESDWREHPVVVLGARSWMSIPLLSGDQAIGVLALQDHVDPDRFNEQSIEWARVFASQAVLAIENARLRDRERVEARTTTLLLEFAQTLHARLGEADIHAILAREAARVLDCEIGSMVLWQADRGRFRVAYVSGMPDEWRGKIESVEFEPQIPMLFSVTAGQLSRRDAPAGIVSLLMERWGVEHLLYLPIGHEPAFLAMLVLGRRAQQPFSADAMRLAEGVAYHAATALENERLFNAAQGANRLKSEFVATMSHELRSPLNVMMGYTDLLRDGQFGPVTPDQVETFNRILNQADQLLQLINTTLDLSRLERGEVSVMSDSFGLSDLFEELQSELAPRLRPAGPQLRWTTAESLPSLHTDRGKLKLIIRNLVDNALKFTDRGAIEVTAEAQSTSMEICVRDTGSGIARESLSTIFEMFRQADASDTRARGGVGLGLYIVRRLATMLGGEVDVESVVGAGSTFRVRIPLRPPVREAERPVAQSA